MPQSREDIRLRVTFFVGSVIGYVDNPSALFTRGIAHGLALRGNEVRIAEERQNQQLVRTLHVVGPSASRHFYDQFKGFQYHTYEPRTGAQLLEWVAREVALIDVAIAVSGVGEELCRWIGNVTREGLLKAYLTFEPDELTPERAAELEINLFDVVLAPRQPAADLPWREIPATIALQDRQSGLDRHISDFALDTAKDPVEAAEVFERALVGR